MVRINSTTGPTKTGSTTGNSKRTGRSRTRASDKVHVADAAALHEKAMALIADMPEVRLDRIESIRLALEQGNYHVNEQQMALRIVINALAERSW